MQSAAEGLAWKGFWSSFFMLAKVWLTWLWHASSARTYSHSRSERLGGSLPSSTCLFQNRNRADMGSKHCDMPQHRRSDAARAEDGRWQPQSG